MTFGRREVLCILLEEDGIMYELWEKLEELKKYRWIELSHPLNNHITEGDCA